MAKKKSSATAATVPPVDPVSVYPLLAYLESSTGLSLKLVVPADLAEFQTATANGQLDLALQDPHTFEATAGLFDDASLLQALGLVGQCKQSAGRF